MNRDYCHTAKEHDMIIKIISDDNLIHFLIEKARFRSIWYSLGLNGTCTTGYGWTLHSRTVSNSSHK